jgi:hypothetical protein
MTAMKPILSLVSVVGGLALLPALAAAQPSSGRGNPGYYSQPPAAPGGFHYRHGMPMVGFSLGLGGMKVDENKVTCPSCDYNPIGVEGDFHIGGMLSDRLGLMLELQGNAQTVDDSYYGSTTLSQGTAMVAAQYWLTPTIWLKGGLGWAHLAYEYDDYYYQDTYSDPVDDGAALMAGAGIELYSADNMAIDLQARFITAGYDGINSKVAALTAGVGINWYGFGSGGGVLVIR